MSGDLSRVPYEAWLYGAVPYLHPVEETACHGDYFHILKTACETQQCAAGSPHDEGESAPASPDHSLQFLVHI